MIEFNHTFNKETNSHVLTITDNNKLIMSTSINEYKMADRTLNEVIDCTMGAVTKVLNELNNMKEEQDERRPQHDIGSGTVAETTRGTGADAG